MSEKERAVDADSLTRNRSGGAVSIEESARDQKLAELELLRQSLEIKEKEIQDYKDRWLRARAEIENIRKRFERERAETQIFLVGAILGRFIAIMDDLRRASEALADQKGLEGKFREGFDLVLKNMAKVFEEHGLAKIGAPLGQPYDPNHHEVVGVEESSSQEGRILRIEEEGYRLGEKILRPAKVVVSKKKPEDKN